MDKHLLTQVKAILSQCDSSNSDEVKRKLMVFLKPDESDVIYQYFSTIEPNFIKETCKINISQVLPQYNDYLSNITNPVESMLFDDYREWH